MKKIAKQLTDLVGNTPLMESPSDRETGVI